LKFAAINKDQLPQELQKLNDAELKAELDRKQKQRIEIQAQIRQLNQQREDFIAQEHKRLEAAGKGDSFDAKVAAIIRSEAAKKGMDYGK
jgi:hypothetical protein